MKAAELVLGEEAKQDIHKLLSDPETKPVGLEALKQCMALELNPYQGDKLRYKANRKPLAEADCRKLKLDGYRVVYRLEPHEGAPARVYVLVVASKRQAYGEGTARAAARLRELAGKRARAHRPKPVQAHPPKRPKPDGPKRRAS